jgi:citrate synthase
MTTGAAAARMTFHSAPEAIQGAVAAAILGAGSVHLGSSEHCAKMLHDALSKEAKDADLDAVALKTVEKRLANNQLIPGIGHGIHTGGDPRAQRLFEVAEETKVSGRNCELLKKIGKIADQKVGKHLPVNVTGAIAAISLDMGFHWQMSKSFAILGRALGGLAHVGEEIRRPIARGISNLIRDNLQYEPEK